METTVLFPLLPAVCASAPEQRNSCTFITVQERGEKYNSVYILKVMAIGIIGATIEFFAFARPASGCADY